MGYQIMTQHDDIIKWKYFPRYWPFVRGIHRSLANSPHKGQWRGALMFSSVRQFRKTCQYNFIFVHVNINSIRYKFAALQEILNKRHVDFLAISESKLDNSFPDSQFQVDGFKIYRHDRSSKSGGLLLYIRENIPHRRLTQYESNCDGIEMICTEINP